MPDKDLPEKLKLEDQFQEILIPIFAAYLSRYRQNILQSAPPPDLDFLMDDFRYSLERHYRRTQDVFRTRVFSGIDPVEFDGAAQDYFEKELETWRKEIADERSKLIVATNQIEAERSISEATTALQAEGKPFSIVDVSNLAVLALKRKFDQRRILLSIMETQAASEATKQSKRDALTNSPTLSAAYATFKFWHSLMDGRERPTHHSANGQERPTIQAFLVGAARLMYPGDPSGPIKEIARCRCYTTSVVIKL